MPQDYKKRIFRLLHILTLIQSETGWHNQALADHFDASARTIFRDIEVLREIGIPVETLPDGGGYTVRKDFFMPAVELTYEEALSLVAMATQVAAAEQIPFMKPAGRAISKIRCQMPSRVQEDLEVSDQHINIKLAAAGSADGIADVYEDMRWAIASKRMLQCRYESLNTKAEGAEPEPFIFHPYKLFFGQRAWYVMGHHDGRNEVRCLKLSRFTQVTRSDRPYMIPEGFDLDDHLGLAWRMIRGSRRYRCEIDFDSHFAETLADTHWHATQEIEEHADGSITFRCEVDGLDEIVWWVLSMGPHAVVKQPAELAQRVRQLAAGVVANYQ